MGSTIVFFPEGAYGPTNNCVGIGDVLRRRGHRVVFIAEESFAGTLEEKGFEERLMRLTPPADDDEDPGQFWKDFIRDTAPVFRQPTIEQLEGFIAPTFEALCDGARYVDERLVEIIDELQPDVIVEDNVVSFPALPASGRPWVRIVSCNPAEVKDPRGPAAVLRLPDGRPSWPGPPTSRNTLARSALCREPSTSSVASAAPRRCPSSSSSTPLPTSTSGSIPTRSTTSAATRSTRPGTTSSRASAPPTPSWELPEPLASGDGPLVYLSLGSLGSADVELMRTLIESLGDSRYRVIVSKGPQHEELELAPNMVGEEFLPQTSILPQVDLVITHGGNNTVTECLHFGKPMVVLPLFWDQYDNAQRIDETGFGFRLATYEHDAFELRNAIDRLLADEPLAAHLDAMSRRLQSAPGTERAADLIEALAGAGE